MEIRTLATGLRFPEGPIALDDGGVLLVEIARGTLTKVAADGTVDGGGRDWAAGPTARRSAPTAPCTSATTAAASAGTR